MRDDTSLLNVVRPAQVPIEGPLLSERERAEREGWARGHAEGLACARTQAAAELAASRAALDSALRALGEAAARAQAVLEGERRNLDHAAAELAFRICEAVLARELALSASPGLEAVQRALAEAPQAEDAVARVHPSDLEAMGELEAPPGLSVVADPAVGPGGCLLEVSSTLVDARLETALARVRAVFDEAMGKP